MSTPALGVDVATGVCAAADAGAQPTTLVSQTYPVRRFNSTVASPCRE
jgi:hypothetical protein